MSHLKCASCLLAAAFLLFAQKKPVTLDDVARTVAPRNALVVWAPDGKRFAYRERNSIWQYDIASKTRKELISLPKLEEKAVKPPSGGAFDWENRRVAERNFSWSPGGKDLLVRAAGDLFLLHPADASWDQLTATADAERDPKLSPDGRLVAFRRGSDLYTIDAASKQVTRLTTDGSETLLNGRLDWVYPEELQIETAYWWSPDSKRIAYLQFDISREPVFPHADLLSVRARTEPQRYPKAGDPNPDVRLGIVPAAGGATRWVDLGETRDALLARVEWLPDSSCVAVQRLNRVQNRLDLLFADPATGAAVPILREQDPYWINVNDHLRFLADGKQFIWGSERDGFRHLYLYSIDGKKSKRITKGEWEVTDVAGVDASARRIYFVSTAESPLERHLYRVDLDGGNLRRLTREPGTHTISMSPASDYYLDAYSSIDSPTRHTIHRVDGEQVAVYRESDKTLLDQYQILPTGFVKVKASDGALLYARLIKPAGFTPEKKYPAIVMVYGGPHAQTVRDAWPGGATWDQMLAHRGYVIWQLDNRGSAGRGHKWESAVFQNLGEKELADQKEGIKHLESLGFVDPARIGMYGWSYGGYMTLYTLTHAPGLIKAGIAGAPVTDWRLYDTIYTERYMGLPSENESGYKKSSPLHKAADLADKLLLVHNFSDDNVHFQNTLQMVDALERAGKQFDLQLYTQKSHGVTGSPRKHMLEGMTAFFDKHLK